MSTTAVTIYSIGHGRYLAEHIPDAKLVELPTADMTIFTDASELALEEIEGILGASTKDEWKTIFPP